MNRSKRWRVLTAHGARWFDGTEGHVLAHEHLLIDNRVWWEGEGPPNVLDPGGPQRFLDELPALRDRPDGVLRENLVLADWYLAASELAEAARAGCGLVVDLTSDGLGPQPQLARTVAELSGVPVVLGLGRYVAAALDDEQLSLDPARLLDDWSARIGRGSAGHGPQFGVLGEIGVSPTPLGPELVSIACAAQLAETTGLPIAIHGPLVPWNHRAFARELEVRGVVPDRTVLCHRDAVLDRDEVMFWASEGYLISFDLFATGPHRSVAGQSFPSDADRIQAIVQLVEDGHADQIVISHDLCTRDQLLRFGGGGYAHIGRRVLPALARVLPTGPLQCVATLNALRWLHVPNMPAEPGPPSGA